MEPVSIPAKRSAKKGSLEDPEILQNVPGHVIPILQREYDDFKTEATQVPRGRHAGRRVHQVPPQAGRLRPAPARRADDPHASCHSAASPPSSWTSSPTSSRSTRRCARATSRRARTSRCTTSRCPTPRRRSASWARPGLSSREGCGNTVRNVTGDPWAGVAGDELFDLTPYAGAYVRYFVRNPTTQVMPRKIKTSFDGAPRDRAISGIHDIAFRARVQGDRRSAHGEVRGVEMLVGGGTSIMPRVAPGAL